MSAWKSPPPAPRASPFNLAIASLGIDEGACRRLFARDIERFAAGATVSGAEISGRSAVIVSGWACEMRILIDGRRQIFTFLVPGDVIDIASRARHSARSIIALTRLEIVETTALVREEAALSRTGLLKEMAKVRQRREERLFDHIVRLGRQSAYERVVHMLLELRDRLHEVGLTRGESFHVPLTQEHLADALGLSLVHVNRTLQQLRGEGLIALKSGAVTLLKPAKLSALAGYEPASEPEPVKSARPSYAEERL